MIDNILDKISPSDLRIDQYRSGKTSNWINSDCNAIQITYVPTGAKFVSENPKFSYHKNKSIAYNLLNDYINTFVYYEATKTTQ